MNTTKKGPLPVITQEAFNQFVNEYYSVETVYRGFMFGEAFYRHFTLIMVEDQSLLMGVKDQFSNEAQASIFKIFGLTTNKPAAKESTCLPL